MCKWVARWKWMVQGGEVVNEGSCCNNRQLWVLWLAATKRCGAVLTKSGQITKRWFPSLQCLVDQWENNQQSVERSRGEVTPEGS